MNFKEAIMSGFENYANFKDRADRPAFWWWFLFCVIVSIVTGILDGIIFGGSAVQPINTVASLALLVPNLAVGARRLHDINKSGWWQLLMITLIGIIPLIYWWCQPGDNGANRFGASPKG